MNIFQIFERVTDFYCLIFLGEYSKGNVPRKIMDSKEPVPTIKFIKRSTL